MKYLGIGISESIDFSKIFISSEKWELVNNINDAFIEMLQRLQIALAQVKLGNTSEKLVNEIRKIIFSLH